MIACASMLPTTVLAQGCPCATPAIAGAVGQASAIFVGKVITVTDAGPGVRGAGQGPGAVGDVSVAAVTMQVDSLLKGSVDKIVVVLTPSVCGYPLAPGSTYLVFAARNPSGLWTDACKGNAAGQAVAGRAAEVLRVLRGK